MATTLIADLLTSWNNPNEAVDVEVSTAPQTYQWTKFQVVTGLKKTVATSVQSCPAVPQIHLDSGDGCLLLNDLELDVSKRLPLTKPFRLSKV